VSCVVAGSYGSYTRPLAIVGGNCSVQVGAARRGEMWPSVNSGRRA
jgi:hypothetical protein